MNKTNIIKIEGIDLTNKRCDIYTLGYTNAEKKARQAVKNYYKSIGWSLRHNYSRPFIRLSLSTNENERK